MQPKAPAALALGFAQGCAGVGRAVDGGPAGAASDARGGTGGEARRWPCSTGTTQLREAGARERDRIAGELHDVVAHGLSLMVVQAGAERLRLGADHQQTRQALDGIERAGRTALHELRTMLGCCAHPTPPPQPTGAAAPACARAKCWA